MKTVTRYVVTHLNKQGMRTLADPMQGRCTFETAEGAQSSLDARMAHNTPATIASVYGLPLEVRPVECYPGHFDPVTCWFDV